MFIKPSGIVLGSKDNYLDNALLSEELFMVTNAELNSDELNMNFRDYYESHVFCKKEQLAQIEQDIDVIIFSGYCGSGHFAPSRALAKAYEENGKNVIIIDLLNMVSPFLADATCNMWLYVSRYNQGLFASAANMVGNEGFSQFALGIYKHMDIYFLTQFIKKHNVKVCISTYLSASCIASKIAEHVKMFGVLVPDASAIAMSCELYKNTKDIVYFTVNEETIEDAKKRYSYHNYTKEFVTIGAVPNFVDKTYSLNPRSRTLTWIVGGGMGLGYGIKALNSIIEAHLGPIVVVCGDNQKWYKKVIDEKEKNIRARIYALTYCSPENIKELMVNSNIIIGKPGGSTMAEFVSMQGHKVLYGAVKGHEEQNAKYAESLGIARYCESTEELVREIKSPIYTKSIYDSNVIQKHPSNAVVEYTLKYL